MEFIDYERRDEVLKKLGYEGYTHYLNSEVWKVIRQLVLNRDNHQCRVCGRSANVVHHNSYEVDVLVGKDLSQLVSLCHYHHGKIEFDMKKGKRAYPK